MEVFMQTVIQGKTLKGKEYAYKFEGKRGSGFDVAYVGKGTNGKVKVSMSKKLELMSNDIKRVFIQTVADDDAAFILEAQWMNEYAKEGKRLLNSICSPEFSKGGIDIFETLKRLLFGKW